MVAFAQTDRRQIMCLPAVDVGHEGRGDAQVGGRDWKPLRVWCGDCLRRDHDHTIGASWDTDIRSDGTSCRDSNPFSDRLAELPRQL